MTQKKRWRSGYRPEKKSTSGPKQTSPSPSPELDPMLQAQQSSIPSTLGGTDWQLAQRYALAGHVGRTLGNGYLQRMVAQLKPEPKDQKEDGEAAQTEAPELVFTLEEAMGGQAELNIEEDFQVSERSEQILYINMPIFIRGVGYTKDRMASIFGHLKAGKDAVEPVYRRLLQSPQSQALQQEFQQAMTAFEATHGRQARQIVRDYWNQRRVNTETITTLLTEIDSLEQEITALLPEAKEAPPASLDITSAQDLAKRLDSLTTKLRGSAGVVEKHAAWKQIFGKAYQKELAGQLLNLRKELNLILKLIKPAGKQTDKTLKAKDITSLRQRLASTDQQGQETTEKFAEQFKAKQQAIQNYNQKYDQVIAAIMDPVQTPALLPQTRRYSTVTFEGKRATYRTHQESRMAYFKDVFNLHSRPRPVPGSPPPRSLDEIGDAQAGPQKKFNNPSVQRAYEVFNQLRAQNVPVSEAKLLAAISSGEGDFSTTQTIDRVRVSWGLVQFQGDTLMKTLRNIKAIDAGFFRKYFEDYGIVIREGRYPGLKPSPRDQRFTPGQAQGIPSSEARGVADLLIYDHNAKIWVSGNEGLEVIQQDPRYQMLFAVVGEKTEAQTAQMMTARSDYLHRARKWKMTLGSGKEAKKIAVKDIFQSEVAMFPLADRIVHTGNVTFVNALMRRYMAEKKKKPEDFASPPDQADFAAFVVEDTEAHMSSVRWHLRQNLEAAEIPDLSDNTYEGN